MKPQNYTDNNGSHYQLMAESPYGTIKGFRCEAETEEDAIKEARDYITAHTNAGAYYFDGDEQLDIVFVNVAHNGNSSVKTVATL